MHSDGDETTSLAELSGHIAAWGHRTVLTFIGVDRETLELRADEQKLAVIQVAWPLHLPSLGMVV